MDYTHSPNGLPETMVTLVALDSERGLALFPDGRAQWIGRAPTSSAPPPPVFCMSIDGIVDFARCASRFVAAGTIERLADETRAATRRPPSRP
jgi:hypothetical protein